MPKKRNKNPSLFNPKHWPMRLVMRVIIPFAWLPYKIQLSWGKKLGKLLQKYGGKMVKVADINLKLCFPYLNPKQHQDLLAKQFSNIGIGVFEFLSAGYGRQTMLDNLDTKITGLEHLKQAIEGGHGAIILFPHLIPMYLAGRLLSDRSPYPFSLMYHTPSEPILNSHIQKRLKKYGDKVFTRRDFRKMINHLKENKVIWYAPDLDLGAKVSEFVPFFNIPAATSKSTSKIAELTGAKIIPIGFYRRENGTGYDIELHPPLDNFPSGNTYTDAELINQTVEKLVRKRPEQYLWIYKRFSSRPNGEEKFY